MNTLSQNDKIEKYLDELADEYKVLLYNALVSRTKPLDDLSVSELLRLDNEIKKPSQYICLFIINKSIIY